MSFDSENGDFWAADVGQDFWEEVNLIVKGGNYGWRPREGFHESAAKAGGVLTTKFNQPEKFIDPVIEYPHSPAGAAKSKFNKHGHGLSITGGYVYRGKKIPALRGAYVYGDYKTGTVWAFRQSGGQVTEYGQVIAPNDPVYRQLWRGQRRRAVPARIRGPRSHLPPRSQVSSGTIKFHKTGFGPSFFVGLFSRGSVEGRKKVGWGVRLYRMRGVGFVARPTGRTRRPCCSPFSHVRRCPSCCGLKALNDFGVFGGEIGFFSGVGFEVVELRILPEHEFPAGVADGLRVCVVVEKMIVRRLGITGLQTGQMFWPSRLRSGNCAPASLAKVGCRSIRVQSSSLTLPAGMKLGQRTRAGTRMPPSAVV